MRWCKVFSGTPDQIREVRAFLSDLLAGYPALDDAVLCATELATNAVEHTASGKSGFFAVEVSWNGASVRVSVADGGAPAAPVLRGVRPEQLPTSGQGLGIVARLASRCGVEGDETGRVVWAELVCPGHGAAHAAGLPLAAEHSVQTEMARLAQRYTGWHTWFGRWTRQWWATPKRPRGPGFLVVSESAQDLARQLDRFQDSH